MKNKKIVIAIAITVLLCITTSCGNKDIADSSIANKSNNNNLSESISAEEIEDSTLNSVREIDSISFNYSVIEGSIKIDKYIGSDLEVIIPSEIDDKKVISIGNYAFSGNDDIRHIYIPDSVKEIGEGAFEDCHSLEDVELPDSIVSLGKAAFEDCHSLEEIELPDSIVSLGEAAFFRSGIKKITIPSGITVIPFELCQCCSRLEEINIPDSVYRIDNWAFASCENLKFVDIGANVKEIGYHAFANCESLSEVRLSEGLELIETMAFFDCFRLEELDIPNNVTTIEDYAFGFVTEEDPADPEDPGRDMKKDFTIICSKGSLAEQYALNSGTLSYDYDKEPFKIIYK